MVFRDSYGSGMGTVWVRGPIVGGPWLHVFFYYIYIHRYIIHVDKYNQPLKMFSTFNEQPKSFSRSLQS